MLTKEEEEVGVQGKPVDGGIKVSRVFGEAARGGYRR